MKTKLLTITILLIVIGNLKAQDYNINFSGIGFSRTVESVVVENLTQETRITLSENQGLHLCSTVTRINDKQTVVGSLLNIYPNPYSKNATIEFYAQKSGLCSIDLFSISGVKLFSVKLGLLSGNQQFEMSGLKCGIYLLKVSSESYSYCSKIMSKGSYSGNPSISYLGQIEINVQNSLLKSNADIEFVDFNYIQGDLLKITGLSGNSSTVKTITPTQSTTMIFNFIPCTDGSGNNYPVVELGTQVWTAINLKTTHYNDGTSIPLVTSSSEWTYNDSPAYCWLNNDETRAVSNNYGALYNMHVVETDKLCPLGWHVPSDEEWQTLDIYIGMSEEEASSKEWRGTQGSLLKATKAWGIGSGTDNYGFTALPAANRDYYNGDFQYLDNIYCFWWVGDGGYYNCRKLYYGSKGISRTRNNVSTGNSVRCVKD